VSRKKSQISQFNDQLGREGVVLVDFNLTGSVPCNSQLPIIDGLSKQFIGKAAIRVLDIDKNRDLAEFLQITSIPTLIILKNGKEVDRFVGLQSQKTLSIAIEKAIRY